MTPIYPAYLFAFQQRLERNTRRLELNFSDHKISPVDTSRLILPLRRHPLPSRCIKGLVSRSEMIGATFLLSLSSNSLFKNLRLCNSAI